MQHNTQTCSTIDLLKEIGNNLNKDIYPHVLDGGIVKPSENATPSLLWATNEKDNSNEKPRQGQTGPAAGSWPRTEGRQGSPDRTGSPSNTPPAVSSALKESYESGLAEVQRAYPSSRVLHREDGFWLLTESSLLPGLSQKAVFLTGIPYNRTYTVQAWGFWSGTPLAYPVWIGPRHTNFGNGSVCAFNPSDNTWNPGGSIVKLIDIYTLWALRQLYLQTFGRWPGRQVAHYLSERIVEIKHDELCGCGLATLYGKCHQQEDLSKMTYAEAVKDFSRKAENRAPPKAVVDFVRDKAELPRLMDLLPIT